MDTPEHTLVDALLSGDEAAFERLIGLYQHRMLRIARLYVRTDAQAHDVVQETWLAVLRGLSRFERRSSLRTWLFHIVANRARTHAVREGRLVPFADAMPDGRDDGTEEAWFDAQGGWAQAPTPWPTSDPEALLLAGEARTAMLRAIDALPPGQKAVVVLRDVEGLEAAEVCNVLEISETNQRVLLHRGRTRLRAVLAGALGRPAR
jgi:RNA polymerase sigma-70 factor (ECF subfamily)